MKSEIDDKQKVWLKKHIGLQVAYTICNTGMIQTPSMWQAISNVSSYFDGFTTSLFWGKNWRNVQIQKNFPHDWKTFLPEK